MFVERDTVSMVWALVERSLTPSTRQTPPVAGSTTKPLCQTGDCLLRKTAGCDRRDGNYASVHATRQWQNRRESGGMNAPGIRCHTTG